MAGVPLPESFKEQQLAFIRSLPKEDIATLRSYTKYGDIILNTVLRGQPRDQLGRLVRRMTFDEDGDIEVDPGFTPDKEKDFVDQYVTRFMEVINKAPLLTEELTLYRGIYAKAYKSSVNEFLSTSYDIDQATRFSGRETKKACCLITLHVKPGVRVLWIESISTNKQEREVLIVPPYTETKESDTKAGDVVVTIAPRSTGGRRRSFKRRKTHRKTRRQSFTPSSRVT